MKIYKRTLPMIAAAFVLAFGMLMPQQASAASEASKQPKATNVQYVKDSSGKNTGIKCFTIDPFTYSNLSQNTVINPNNASTLKLDDATLLRIAKQDIFPKWGVIAEGIFRDQANQLVTIEGSGMMSSDTSSKTSFDRHFSTGKVSNGYTDNWAVKDLAAYLGSSSGTHQGKLCWDEVRVTGPTQIGSLNGARTLMGQELRNCSDDNDVSKDDFLGNDYQKNDDKRRLPDLEDDKSGDGFANIVTCVNRAGASGDYDYVSFGLAVYGFDITPVAAENLKYIEAADDSYDGKTGEEILMGLAGNVDKTGISFHNDTDSGTTTYIRNNTTQEVTQTSGLENSITEESTISTDDTYEWGMEQEIGVELNLGGWGGGIQAGVEGFAAPCMFPRATLSMSNSWHELWSTTKSTSDTKSTTKTKTTNTEVTLPGHTIAVVNQSLENTKTTENYQQPVILSYKVAVFAMSGDYFNGASGGITSSRYDKQWMSVLFDGSDDVNTSGCKALGSLYNRGVTSKDISGYDGAKGKYRSWCDKSAWNSSSKINWNDISSTLSSDSRPSHRILLSTGKKATTVKDLATELPLLEKAQMLTSKRENTTSSVDQIVALYPLASVGMTTGSKQYELVPRGQESDDTSNVLHLDPIKVEGYDKDNADFYEFDPSWGKWELLDEDGNVIEDNSAKDESDKEGVVRIDNVLLVTDSNLDTQRIEIARSGDDLASEKSYYIQWKLKKGDDAKIISNESLNRDKEQGGPFMTDEEKEEVSTPTVEIVVTDKDSDIVNFETEGSYKGPWDESINLGHYFNVDPVDQSGKIRGVPVYWESKGTPGITVSENGQATFTKRGTYKVRPYSYNIEDKKIIPRDKNGDPVWLEVTAQDKVKLSKIEFNKPDMDESETELTEGKTTIGFDLSSYIKFYDQYGDIWEGDVKETTDEGTGETITERVLPEIRYSVLPYDSAVIDNEDILTISRPGTYIVRAMAYDEKGDPLDITIKPIRIDITEQARLASIAFAEPALTRGDRTLKSKDSCVRVDGLKNLISYEDQHGNEWEGTKPNITFSMEGVGESAEIKGDSFFAYEPGRYTIRASAQGYTIDPITIVILEDADLVLKTEDPGRQYLYSEDDQVAVQLDRYIDALNTFGNSWKGNIPELNFTLDEPVDGATITTEPVYEDGDDYEGVDRHFFRTNVPGEYKIHVEPKKASEYTEPIDDINIRVVKGRKVARIEFVDIEERLGVDKLAINHYNSYYPAINFNHFLKYYDGFGEEIDPVNDHVKIPDCKFELVDADQYDADSYDLEYGTLTSYKPDGYFIKATMNVTNNDPGDEGAGEDTVLEDMTAIYTYDIDWLHNFGEWEITRTADCTTDGERVKMCKGHDMDGDGEIDKACDFKIEDAIPATGHVWQNSYSVNPGKRFLYNFCTECDEDMTVPYAQEINYKGVDIELAPDCTTEGIYRLHSRDGSEWARVRVPALGHKWSKNYVVIKEATCQEEGLEAIVCERCGKDEDGNWKAIREGSEYQRIIPRKEHTPAAGPDKDKWPYSVVDGKGEKETCEDYGWKTTECSECGEKLWKLVMPTGHDWDAPEYKWAADNKSVTATRVCKNDKDKDHVQTETVTTAAKVTKKATYTAKGQTTYTATFANSAFKTQTRTVTNIPKLPKNTVTAPTGKVTILNTIANSSKKTNDAIWDKSKVKGANKYELNWKSRTSKKWASATVGNVTRGKTTGLSIGGLYDIRVRPVAVSTDGKKKANGSWSPTVHRYFHTTGGIDLKSNSKGSFTMKWRKNSAATGYQVMFTTNSNGSGAAKNINTVGASGTSFTKKGLKSGTTYYVQIREIKKVGGITYVGNISNPVAVKVK